LFPPRADVGLVGETASSQCCLAPKKFEGVCKYDVRLFSLLGRLERLVIREAPPLTLFSFLLHVMSMGLQLPNLSLTTSLLTVRSMICTHGQLNQSGRSRQSYRSHLHEMNARKHWDDLNFTTAVHIMYTIICE